MGLKINRSGRVTGREIRKNRDRDRNTRLLQAEVTDPEDVRTVEHLTQSGEDTSPPDNAQIIIINVGEAWQIAVASDDKIPPSVLPGEKKIYSTNQGGDTEKAKIHLKQTGEIEINNGQISITLAANGDMTISTPGDIEFTSASLTHNGTNIGDDHVHGGVQSGGSTTGGPQ